MHMGGVKLYALIDHQRVILSDVAFLIMVMNQLTFTIKKK
jgi:hypothetical protein